MEKVETEFKMALLYSCLIGAFIFLWGQVSLLEMAGYTLLILAYEIWKRMS